MPPVPCGFFFEHSWDSTLQALPSWLHHRTRFAGLHVLTERNDRKRWNKCMRRPHVLESVVESHNQYELDGQRRLDQMPVLRVRGPAHMGDVVPRAQAVGGRGRVVP